MRVMMLRFKIVGEGEEMSRVEIDALGERLAAQLDVHPELLVFDGTSVIEEDD